MKKPLLFLGLAVAGIATAQSGVEPIFETGLYPVKISYDGKWVGSATGGTAAVYNVETGEFNRLYDTSLGLGNIFTDEGIAVGNELDRAVIIRDGKSSTPQSLRNSWFIDLNAITPDGSRLCGIINNPVFDNWDLNSPIKEPSFIAFYCDIDENFEVGEPVFLPVPETDFFGAVPQFITAVWISGDGKKILGQVQDDFGYYSYPIFYTQDDNNEWSYSYPTESLFNPDKIVMPEDPWANEPEFPEVTDFMDPDAAELYEEMKSEAIMGWGEYPDPLDFMTNEQEKNYREAVENYNNWFYNAQIKIREYTDAYFSILSSSVNFPNNDFALSPDGKTFVAQGVILEPPTGSSLGTGIYQFSTESDEFKFYKTPADDLKPSQILSNGTIIANTPFDLSKVVDSYIKTPESDKFVPVKEYFESFYPAFVPWMEETIPNGSGHVSVSEDMKVFAGGVIFDAFKDHGIDLSDEYDFDMYIFVDGQAGIYKPDSLSDKEYYNVYNINGYNVLNTADRNDLNRLPDGLYIINGQKVFLRK